MDNSKEQIKITIEAVILSDIKKVWVYYTEPEHITQWNFADPSWQCPSAENDLRVGGKYTARMEARDGSAGFDFEAVYDEIIEHNKIAFTMTDGRQAVITFEQIDDSIKVVIIFDAESTYPVEFQKHGWQSILNNFKNYVETN